MKSTLQTEVHGIIISIMKNAFLPACCFALLLSLLCAGCDPGVPVPPLCMAARAGDLARIGHLVNSGADVNERGGVNNWTALMHAVHKNQPEAVQALIAAGADVNATAGARGRDTALRLAELQKLPQISAMLRAHGAASAP
jgi:ankyrin repeat protein